MQKKVNKEHCLTQNALITLNHTSWNIINHIVYGIINSRKSFLMKNNFPLSYHVTSLESDTSKSEKSKMFYIKNTLRLWAGNRPFYITVVGIRYYFRGHFYGLWKG